MKKGCYAAALSISSMLMTANAVAGAMGPVEPELFSWTGAYAGANLGTFDYSLDQSLSIVNNPVTNYFNPVVIPQVNANGSRSFDKNGVYGGLQGGYNYQVSPLIVVGIEGDYSFVSSSLKSIDTGNQFNYTTNGAPYFINSVADIHDFWTIRPRVGLTKDQTMIFITGGLASTTLRFTQFFSEPPFTPVPESIFFSDRKYGWTIGAGGEIAINKQWSVMAQYLYAKFDSSSVSGTLATAAGSSPVPGFVDGATFNNTIDGFHVHTGRLGINYHFDLV